jgi:hypothetical protein
MTCFPNRLRRIVFQKAHMISYPIPSLSPNFLSIRSTMDKGYFILQDGEDQRGRKSKGLTHNSPDFTMSHKKSRCPCRQVQAKIPEIANKSNIFFRSSELAAFHLSTHVSTHFSNASSSLTLSQATGSESRGLSV